MLKITHKQKPATKSTNPMQDLLTGRYPCEVVGWKKGDPSLGFDDEFTLGWLDDGGEPHEAVVSPAFVAQVRMVRQGVAF